MIRGTKIENHKNISIKDNIKKIDNSDYIYIPLKTYNNTNCTCNVKAGDYVYKGQVIALSNDKYKMPIHSSVSGKVSGIIEENNSEEKFKVVVIENDYLEKEKKKIGSKNIINNYTIDEAIKLIHENGVVGLGGQCFPTYYKYNTELKINTLIINAVESEPFLTCDFTLLKEKTSEILETIDALMEIFKIEKCIIAIKNYNKQSMNNLIEYIGSYPQIEIKYVKDIYPIGFERSLIKHLLNISYNKYSMEKGIIVNNISTVYSIYKALKFKKPTLDRIITVSGDGINNPQNVKVKYGTKIKNIIESIGGYSSDKVFLIIHGVMRGNSISTDENYITKDVTGITVLKETQSIQDECINCGKCANICPVRLSPVLIMNNQKYNIIINKLNSNKCVECGLCSYICPSKINLKEIVMNCKKEVK